MKVRELVKALEQIQDQDAPVLIGKGLRPDLWLVVTGIVERGIERRDALDSSPLKRDEKIVVHGTLVKTGPFSSASAFARLMYPS